MTTAYLPAMKFLHYRLAWTCFQRSGHGFVSARSSAQQLINRLRSLDRFSGLCLISLAISSLRPRDGCSRLHVRIWYSKSAVFVPATVVMSMFCGWFGDDDHAYVNYQQLVVNPPASIFARSLLLSASRGGSDSFSQQLLMSMS